MEVQSRKAYKHIDAEMWTFRSKISEKTKKTISKESFCSLQCSHWQPHSTYVGSMRVRDATVKWSVKMWEWCTVQVCCKVEYSKMKCALIVLGTGKATREIDKLTASSNACCEWAWLYSLVAVLAARRSSFSDSLCKLMCPVVEPFWWLLCYTASHLGLDWVGKEFCLSWQWKALIPLLHWSVVLSALVVPPYYVRRRVHWELPSVLVLFVHWNADTPLMVQIRNRTEQYKWRDDQKL